MALTHDEVCEGCNLIDHRFLGYLKDMAEEVGVAPVVVDRSHPCPADGDTCLATPKRPPAGIGDDNPDILLCDPLDCVPDLGGGPHGVGREDDYMAVLDVAVVDTRAHTDVAGGHLREDEGVFEQDIA